MKTLCDGHVNRGQFSDVFQISAVAEGVGHEAADELLQNYLSSSKKRYLLQRRSAW